MRNSAEALLTIINDILDFSKIEAGKYELESIEFDVRQAIEEVAVLLAEPAHKKGLELCCLIHHDVPRLLRGDPGRVRQVLTNLVGNAVKFTEKGEVVIRAGVELDEQARVQLRIEVEDTGIGISAEGRKRLFASFSQVDASTTRKYGGTGLGLAISKKLTELMGGQIGVDSIPGKGSTFYFSVRLDKVLLPRDSDPAAEINLRGMRVLIVDDNETNRKLLRLLIHNWGMTCDECEDAYRSLGQLYQGVTTNQPYDFMIIDMQMPGMDGLELSRIIRGDPRFAQLPLIMLTSLGERGFADKARQSGVSAYLSKPVRQSQLFDCLMATLSMPGARIDVGSPAVPLLITRHTLAAQKPQAGPMVLIVEDNPVNQKVLVGLLRQLGHRADVANNGREAVAALFHSSYGLVLMDCIMPELDGFEATAEIRNRELSTGRRVPIVALSASNLEEDRRRAMSAGMDDFITKPIRPEELERVVTKWLTQAAHAEQTPAGLPTHIGRTKPSAVSGNIDKPLVLVAEDNPINQRVAFAILAQLGYRAEVVSTGMEALKSLETKDYDAILMDCQMPEMDGYEATAEIRYREGMARHTPIIAMTANAMQGDRERALASGMDDYLAKPVRPAELELLLKRYINPGGEVMLNLSSAKSMPNGQYLSRDPLDVKTVEGLRSLVQDGGEFFRELVTTYLSDLPTQIHGLRLAVTASDARHIRECAHAIKGSSHNMGAVILSNQCGDLEERARNGDLVDAFRLLSRIEREVVRVTTAFRSLITQEPRHDR